MHLIKLYTLLNIYNRGEYTINKRKSKSKNGTLKFFNIKIDVFVFMTMNIVLLLSPGIVWILVFHVSCPMFLPQS